MRILFLILTLTLLNPGVAFAEQAPPAAKPDRTAVIAPDTLPEDTAVATPEAEAVQDVAAEPTTKAATAVNPLRGRAEESPPVSGSLALSKIVISLALVVMLVIGLGWLFKKLTLRLPGSRQMKVICAMPLGQRERILVIEIQGKQRVIGVTPHSINLLFELENPLPEEKLASDFHTQLQSFLKK